MTDNKDMEKPLAGIDIGGTKMRWVIMKPASHESWPWKISSSHQIPTPHTRAAFTAALRETVERFHAHGITRAGISMAGVIRRNTLVKSPNLRFLEGMHFKEVAPGLVVDNDARCFGIAESVAMRTRGIRATSALVITLGTGIGRSLIRRDGSVASIMQFEAPEPWERDYQRVAEIPHPSVPAITRFLVPHLADLVKAHHPDTLVLAGGRLRSHGLFTALRRGCHQTAIPCTVRRSYFRQNEGAMGAAFLTHSSFATKK